MGWLSLLSMGSIVLTIHMALFAGMSWWWPAAFIILFIVIAQIFYNDSFQKK